MRSIADYEQVMHLVEEGLSDAAIARLTAVPRRTVHDWRGGRGAGDTRRRTTCPICAGTPEAIPLASYAYLLGAYLGDGHIVESRRGVHRLRVYCDARHPGIAGQVADAIGDVVGRRAAIRRSRQSRVLVVSSYSKHWPCLFPEHGPGRKHDRHIVLAEWQRTIAATHPDRLLRGLIHSDGSRFINRVAYRDRRYEYVRYQFTNASSDIRGIFCESCDALAIAWRPLGERDISVARRASVAKLDAFVGPKS